MQAADTEVSEYAEDQWTMTRNLSANLGTRITSQSTSRRFAFAPRAGLAYSLPDGKTSFRGGAGIIYGHVPMLSEDLAGYQTRILTFASAPNQPITLLNTYLPAGSNSAGPDDPGNSPRTLMWDMEVESELRENLTVRLTYYETHTADLFILNPIVPVPGTSSNGFLVMQNTGTSNYRQAQIAARYRFRDRAEVNGSYAWSQARGDLNSLSDTFIPIQVPILRPNLYGILPSDIPSRLLIWGFVHVPWKMVFTPIFDIQSGFPYSNIDGNQNYLGVPNTNRFPIYFSTDARLYRDFIIHMPFGDRTKPYSIRLGISSLDLTNRHNPHDVFNNSALGAPLFGQFDGFQRRFTEFLIVLTK